MFKNVKMRLLLKNEECHLRVDNRFMSWPRSRLFQGIFHHHCC